MLDPAIQKYVTYVLICILLADRQTLNFCLIAWLLATFKGINAFVMIISFRQSQKMNEHTML